MYKERKYKMDKDLLVYYMKKNNVSIEKMCKELTISRSAFYRKLNGSTEFVLSEIQKITEVLKLESPTEIFFAQ